MAYSCTDYVDDLHGTLARRGVINNEELPDDNPEGQADVVMPAIERLMNALDRIKEERDYHAEHARYSENGPGKDQAFDDWAADIAEKAMKPGP
jgi:hypothetical protein